MGIWADDWYGNSVMTRTTSTLLAFDFLIRRLGDHSRIGLRLFERGIFPRNIISKIAQKTDRLSFVYERSWLYLLRSSQKFLLIYKLSSVIVWLDRLTTFSSPSLAHIWSFGSNTKSCIDVEQKHMFDSPSDSDLCSISEIYFSRMRLSSSTSTTTGFLEAHNKPYERLFNKL